MPGYCYYPIPFKNQNDWQTHRPLTPDYYAMMDENPIDSFLKDFLTLDSTFVDHLDEKNYFRLSNVYFNDSPDLCAISRHTLYALYKCFFEDNNCEQKKWKSKLKFFQYIGQKHQDAICTKKILEMSTKEYFIVDLRKLWKKYWKHEYVETHFLAQKQWKFK